ncbi:MAG: DUF4340 domain-containing protein [Treponema sp.]|jgi:hypothetical protein|nr:DUF4340 domain-containing protein [Treponema sp.]
MVYKKKLILLSSLAGFLAVVYLITLFFDPERVSSRNAAFLWLDPKLQDQADGIELAKAGEWDNPLKLVRRGSNWHALIGEAEFPAKNVRVEDLFRSLSARAAYPVRGSDAASQERLGLSENRAARILIKGGAGLPLLDLLIGGSDAAGREVYMRKNGQNEIRSGEDQLSAYLNGAETSWYRLGLFSESPNPPDAAMVQRVTVYPLPPEEGEETVAPSEPMVIARSGSGWTIEGLDDDTVDAQRVDSYMRGILEAEGDNFVPGMAAATAGFSDGRILVEMGNGSSLTITVGILSEGQKAAAASGSPYVYTLADWTVSRLFRERSYFVQ